MAVAGSVIGDGVRLVRLLGRGSHSAVYFAVDREGQPRSVKVFPDYLAPFADREYAHGVGLTHPRLAPVLARTALEECPALVLTYARGQTLFQRYVSRPALLAERQAFLLTMTHLIDALGYLHGRGLVHRDIKPDNIIVEPEGAAKLVDYDLSGRAYEPLALPTRIGTGAFLSPEAARGDPQGPESDLYGVGVLLGWGIHGQLLTPGEAAPMTRDPLTPLWRSLTRPDRRARPRDAAAVRAELLELAQKPL